ncbi:MAG: M20/M25/M40 family metallo-hydrolase, partial [Gemmobacter sp.]|nr:M20/M25/M40 family metallo-hydrolase [Gemmobacter sp.]
ESEAFNVIPQTVELRGTVRTLENEVRAMAQARVRAIADHTAAAFGATATVHWRDGYPVMSNHPEETTHAARVAADVSGQEVLEVPPLMGGEDFAYMLEERPGAYILVGNGNTASVHHPAYDFDDNVIPAGVSWFVGLAETRMPVA